MSAKKCKKKNQVNYFSLMRKKGRNKIQIALLKKYDEHDSVQDKQMFLKRVILWYAMLSYAMVWYGKYGVL